MILPTPPPIESPAEVWDDYVHRVLSIVADAVERTETRGMTCTVQFEIRDGWRVACEAFFCFDCSALHVMAYWYDQDEELAEKKQFDPADLRDLTRAKP